ncbi:MAG: UPF0058 family protein [Halobacteriales archaeon]|nr:UPF0058 family protein [Halobacteriales archaeon]
MNKQELIHVHGLLAEVRRWYTDRERDLECPRYMDHGVWPTTIPAPKADHERAIQILAGALARELGTERSEPLVIEAV